MKEHIQVEALWIWDQNPILLNAILEGISSPNPQKKTIEEPIYSRIQLNYEQFHLMVKKELLYHQMSLSNNPKITTKPISDAFLHQELQNFRKIIIKLPTNNSVIFEVTVVQFFHDQAFIHLNLIKEITADKRTFPRFIGKLPTQIQPIQASELQNYMQMFPNLYTQGDRPQNTIESWNVPDPIVNFSVGGLGVVTHIPIVVGQFVIIGFLDLYSLPYRRFIRCRAGHIAPQNFDTQTLPEIPNEFHAIGEVVRCKSNEVILEDNSTQAIFEVGINFLQIEEDAQELLEELTLSIQETTLPFAKTSAK